MGRVGVVAPAIHMDQGDIGARPLSAERGQVVDGERGELSGHE